MVLFNHTLNATDFGRSLTAAALQYHGVEPELGDVVVSLHTDMWRFNIISRVEEKGKGPFLRIVGMLVAALYFAFLIPVGIDKAL